MATIDTPAVATGELITSVWGNTVRQDLLDLNADLADARGDASSDLAAAVASLQTRQAQAGPFANVIAGAGNDTTTGATFTTWLTIGSVLPSGVPAWATAATITIHVTNVQAITADCVYSFTATIGGGSYGSTVHGTLSMPAASSLASFSFVVPISSPSGMTGPQVVVGARRDAGTGIIRASSASRASAQVLFR